MNSVIIHAYSITDLTQKIDNKLSKNFKPSLAFVYTSPRHNIRKLVVEFNNYPFLVFGATTVGEIYADQEHGVNEKEESIVCMLLDIDPRAIALRLFQVEDNRYYEIGEHVGKWALQHFNDPAIITVTSGLNFDNDAYTQGMTSNKIEYAFGGAAGDDLILKDTFVFSKENYSNHGIVTLAIDREKIDILGARAFGWTGIGKERIVTKAEKNIVYEIDGKRAIDFYKKYLNITAADMPQVGIEYPLEVTMRNGQVVYRAVLDIDEEQGALVFAGHVEEKSKVRLSSARGKTIIQHVGKSIEEALAYKKDFTPEVTLVFPCCSRKQVLGDLVIQEIEAVYTVTKQTPLIGFFAYGEIGAYPGGYGFHNETFVTALLSEKEK
ncbi:FIST C-terminal domain-containing protein [bacterium]|nr:FIST C-terminal domain-containing protein [bacterium]MBU1958900.1 FIST C-terminal domain-containing protein [bacterium]